MLLNCNISNLRASAFSWYSQSDTHTPFYCRSELCWTLSYNGVLIWESEDLHPYTLSEFAQSWYEGKLRYLDEIWAPRNLLDTSKDLHRSGLGCKAYFHLKKLPLNHSEKWCTSLETALVHTQGNTPSVGRAYFYSDLTYYLLTKWLHLGASEKVGRTLDGLRQGRSLFRT
jgi:hypothetical protein